jgi:hypothetical protein
MRDVVKSPISHDHHHQKKTKETEGQQRQLLEQPL